MANNTNTAGREALQAYLKDCDAHAIVPDVGGAWHAAFQAGRASLAPSGFDAADTNTAEREAFEAWCIKQGRSIKRAIEEYSHEYESTMVQNDWEVWQACAKAMRGFDAADMATASAQGFRDGVASLAASAGSEPVAVAEVSCTHVHGWGTRWIVDADRKLNIPPLGTKLYARPPAPKQGQKDSSHLRKALIRAQQAINSMKVEAETAAQGDKRMMLEACETISNEGLQADMAIRDVLANHPSPPEGKAGWKLVPVEPTDDMLRAMDRACSDAMHIGVAVSPQAWAAGIAAAPPLPASEAKEL